MSTALALFPAPATLAVDRVADESFDSGAHPEDDPEEWGDFDDHGHGFVEDGLGSMSTDGMTSGFFFNESAGCDEPAGVATPMSTTNSTSNRSLPSGHQVRGPWGDFFGRDYGDVYGSLVDWVVPMSGGRVVKVHERALPGFQRVADNLAVAAATGKNYTARIASAFVWRRIGGSYRMSTHAFGTTIDINWDKNPYRSDNRLITDMPQWYVDAWKEAGFCWGGDWINIKDPMHFSWKGPAATEGYGEVAGPYPPVTAARSYDQLAFSGSSSFGSVSPDHTYAVLDGNRDGAPDLYRARRSGASDLTLQFARSSRDFGWCGVSETTVSGAGGVPGDVVIADFDGDTRPDVVVVDDTGATITVRAYTFRSNFADPGVYATSIPSPGTGSYLFADYNDDAIPDLYVIEREGETRVSVWDAADGFATELVNAVTDLGATANTARWRFDVADWDTDGVPDVLAFRILDSVQVSILHGASGYAGVATIRSTSARADRTGAYGIADYDGDGRGDVYAVGGAGQLEVWLGGNQGADLDFWFRQPSWSCDGVGTFVPWDLNGDRIADLTIGAPGEDVATLVDAGQVHVLYSDENGPSAADDEFWHQDTPSVEGPAEAGDRFGAALTSGDFDGDGYGDLAVGAPDDGVGSVGGAGVVNVIYGSAGGLNGGRTDMWHQDVPSVAGVAGIGAGFGSAVAAGDFNADGRDDLVVGVPGETASGTVRAGAINVLYGTKSGLGVSGNQRFRIGDGVIRGTARSEAALGSALAVGDFNADGYDDVAVGAPGYAVRGRAGAGSVVIIFGSAEGLTGSGNQLLSERGTVSGVPRAGDRFGADVAAGDFDGDGFDDVGIGVPGKARRGHANAGLVHVLRGGPQGITIDGQQKWAQSSPGVPGAAEKNDRFGASLGAGDYNGDGFSDLTIGAPNEGIDGAKNAGSVLVLVGSVGGVQASGALHLRAGYDGLAGSSETGDRFGSTLVSADFNGDGHDDLAIGTPGEDQGAPDAGAVLVVCGSATGLAFGTSRLWHQDTPGVEGVGESGDNMGVVR